MKITLHSKTGIYTLVFLIFELSFSQATLLKDIYPGSGSSNPSGFFKYNNGLLFSAQDANNNKELWKTDGTLNGTVLVKDIRAGSDGSNPGSFKEMNGIVYFGANDGVNGSELWKTDGTEQGTELVKDINPGLGNSIGGVGSGVVFKNELYFVANSASNNLNELWKTDGTESGTVLVKSFRPFSYNSSNTSNLLVGPNSNEIFFTADDGSGFYLWKTDGTTSGTVKVKSLYNTPSYRLGNFGIINSEICFTAYNYSGKQSLWKSDGSVAGTLIYYDNLPVGNLSVINSKVFNNKLYFEAYSTVYGTELWSTDGTYSGTQMLKDIIPGTASSSPDSFFELNNELFFQVSKVPETELWKTDGTGSGTQFVKNIHPGYDGSIYATYPIPELNKFYFTGDDGTGRSLWESNGTTSGTIPLYDISESDLPLISVVTFLNNKLLFTKESTSEGFELWSFDATLGLADKEIYNNSKIYPNPVTNTLFFKTPFSTKQQLQVFNQLGQQVLQQNSNESSTWLDVSNLSKGLYFLNITSENSNSQTIKFIKN